ncbi:VOC family protein [Paenibacillus senegalensis]|uniref:VOC family protein n=1 Tax=Paenibacillus senegalensis TaxID=1465766 RepID=UPI00028A194C|nr:VOC family protein [Paenibacillus senegalensis]
MNMNERFIERIDAVFLPVKNLEESLSWYTEVFRFPLRWKNKRVAGLSISPNCGFHLVEVKDYVAQKGYTPFNFVVKDVEEVRNKLKSMKVKVSGIKTSDPVRFDFIDVNGNAISVIQLG